MITDGNRTALSKPQHGLQQELSFNERLVVLLWPRVTGQQIPLARSGYIYLFIYSFVRWAYYALLRTFHLYNGGPLYSERKLIGAMGIPQQSAGCHPV